MVKKKFVIKEETRKRCKIVRFDAKISPRFEIISTELLHFLYNTAQLDFAIYFRVKHELIEFIPPGPLSRELVDQLIHGIELGDADVDVRILKADHDRFQHLLGTVRSQKIENLLLRDPYLDRKTLEVFNNLSGASQLVVRGGINPAVADAIKITAAFLVDNLINNDVALGTLSRMVECDPTLYDHSASVAMISGVIATRLLKKPMGKKEAELVARCGLYHDVGKTCVPSAVLNKPGRFTPEEWEVMKTHTTLGHQELQDAIQKGAPIEPEVARVAIEHHERFDGSGYPCGLMGRLEEQENGIHLYTRVVTVADVYSALLMKRIYKPAFEPEQAIKIMADVADREYDPEIFIPFLRDVVKSLNLTHEHKHKGKSKGKIIILQDGKIRLVS